DEAGRPFHTTQMLRGLMNPLDGEYHTYTEFDSHGRVYKQRYPGVGLAIRHEYQNGYAYKLVNDNDGRVYQHITAVNASGQTTGVSYANGTSAVVGYFDETGLIESNTLSKGAILHDLDYTYDANNNLKTRDHTFGVLSQNARTSESYTYDDLNRLIDRTVTLPTAYSMNEAYRFDGFGNFSSKQGNKFYKYDINKRLTGIYSNAGFTGAKLYDFEYDNNGNVTFDGSRNISYSSFDKPIQLSKGNYTATEFIYGMGHSRYYRHDKRVVNGAEVNTHTAYLGGLEKIYQQKTNDTTDLIEYKMTVGNVVITERTNADNNASTAEAYLHKDHLGSPLTITDKNGSIIQQNVYDPWGKVYQLYLDDSGALGGHLPATTRGYTGHEGIDELDIIHMNGRIYDANIGRFLQADPFIQAPKNSQSYNRYAYVINNPLTLTDPSGFNFWDKALRPFKNVVRGVMRAIGQEASGILVNFISSYCGPFYEACQAIGNYDIARAFGASSSGALRAGAIAGVMAYIGENGNQFVQAVAGGVVEKAQGGKFAHGFGRAALNPAPANTGNPQLNVVIDMVVGGTISEVTGGKFKNGAASSAFYSTIRQDWSGAQAQKDINIVNGKKIDSNDPMAKLIEELMGQDTEVSRQQAINAAIVYFNIDMTHKGEFFYPIYDADSDIFGTIESGRINIGRAAFTGGLGVLGSTIFHEMVHIRQGWRNS
ncbi:MAG: hypothetical protein MJK04_19245, partial [Psychrosphaera sp.]|nr:hypothetical protein [Psychrosphaera sp.]